MENYLKGKNIHFSKEKDIYRLINDSSATKEGLFHYSDRDNINHNFSTKNFFSKLEKAKPEETEVFLLPYIAWLRNNSKYNNLSYRELQKLALESIVRYNI